MTRKQKRTLALILSIWASGLLLGHALAHLICDVDCQLPEGP